jgi:hypothetical protein
MDTLKKKPGRKSKAEITALALDAALPKLGELAQAAPAEAPPPVAEAMPVAVEVVPEAATQPAPLFVIDVPAWLADSAIPFNEQCPSDVRAAIQTQVGCVARLRDGLIHCQDGRVMRPVLNGYVIEVFGA